MYPDVGAYSKCFLDEVADVGALLCCCTIAYNSDSADESAIVACVLLPSRIASPKKCSTNPVVLFLVVLHDAQLASGGSCSPWYAVRGLARMDDSQKASGNLQPSTQAGKP